MTRHAAFTRLTTLVSVLPALMLAEFSGAVTTNVDASGKAPPPSRHTRLIKVLSYNIHGLPEPFGWDYGQFQEIGRILAGRRAEAGQPDFVLLQESFTAATEALRREAHYPHEARCPKAAGKAAVHSGLFILSEHPLIMQAGLRFTNCASDDCFAAKGVLLASVQPVGMPEPFFVLTTHLQAHTEKDKTRISQIDQMASWFEERKVFSLGSIFAGDFNFKPGKHPSYAHFVKHTPFADVGKKCVEETAGCTIAVGGVTDLNDISKSAHDRQFVYTPERGRYQIRPIFITRNFTEKLKGNYLSDHWGYEVHYEFSWRE